MNTISRDRLAHLLAEEIERFDRQNPRSRALHERAKAHLHDGVPMNWMVRWAGGFPLFVESAQGARFRDVDGHEIVDLCLGDTGAMTGHAPPAVLEAIRAQLDRGLTFMLPTEDAIWVGQELARRFGLPFWQFASTATDANRFATRLARHITGRPKVLVFNGCYHGTVDETFATLDKRGRVVPRAGNLGPPVDPSLTTSVVEWNDLAALESALVPGDVACVLAEPVMTNVGIVHPEPGFHAALRDLTRQTGTLLLLDETHTISAGPGGCTQAQSLEPDFLTLGKPIGGGIAAAVYGFTTDVAERIRRKTTVAFADTGGIGGTLAGNALALAAVRATLSQVLTDEAYRHTIPLADRFAEGVQGVLDEFEVLWIVQRLGCRAEYWFQSTPPRNGREAAATYDADLDRYMHLAALNRGVLMTPFHNMALMSPATTARDVDHHTEVFRESLANLVSTST